MTQLEQRIVDYVAEHNGTASAFDIQTRFDHVAVSVVRDTLERLATARRLLRRNVPDVGTVYVSAPIPPLSAVTKRPPKAEPPPAPKQQPTVPEVTPPTEAPHPVPAPKIVRTAIKATLLRTTAGYITAAMVSDTLRQQGFAEVTHRVAGELERMTVEPPPRTLERCGYGRYRKPVTALAAHGPERQQA